MRATPLICHVPSVLKLSTFTWHVRPFSTTACAMLLLLPRSCIRVTRRDPPYPHTSPSPPRTCLEAENVRVARPSLFHRCLRHALAPVLVLQHVVTAGWPRRHNGLEAFAPVIAATAAVVAADARIVGCHGVVSHTPHMNGGLRGQTRVLRGRVYLKRLKYYRKRYTTETREVRADDVAVTFAATANCKQYSRHICALAIS